MDVEWTLTEPSTGRTRDVPTWSSEEGYREQLASLLREGSGYTEVSRVGSPYPALTLSINEGLAVVHRFDDAETCMLLKGTGQVAADETRDFPIQTDEVAFTGEFISTAARGVDVLIAFAQGVDIRSLGTWVRL
jgi:hypothetical protein